MTAKEQAISFEEWMSPRARAERKAKSLAARLSAQEVAVFTGEPLTMDEVKVLLARRKTGKLNALIKIAKRGFNKRFKQVGKYRYRAV